MSLYSKLPVFISFLILSLGCSSSRNAGTGGLPEWYPEQEFIVIDGKLWALSQGIGITEVDASKTAFAEAGLKIDQLLFEEAFERSYEIFMKEVDGENPFDQPFGEVWNNKAPSQPKLFRDLMEVEKRQVRLNADEKTYLCYLQVSYPLDQARRQVLDELKFDEEVFIAFTKSEAYEIFIQEYPFLRY